MKLIASLLFSFCIFALVLRPNFASEEEVDNAEQTAEQEVADTSNQEAPTEQEQSASDELTEIDTAVFDINMTNIITGPTVCTKGKRPDRRGKCRTPSF
ncbi:hypothetical protein CpipJ_CPIJ000535 [Culex quinquefasciatus]|uniref:Uncharacterized protein n=1 Tax=Culex quinquefasciatus TaxID=7176 RepID=B0W0H1_CULQU|nr:hypothetical protein CpipJ_CPIJ000535 [Culex quinquefasciatus]|eukprot:XP_001842205.1 hypothetical protein CpipJ_CPIJ000535 [Culex quinquefasciatus]